ncbi:HD domain-containing protein [Sulfobacillus sp. DSM 109850]|uniref:HD domain-containing protein n=2 Tax=Sulfobacillus harzensis TaxID=2729629 RepID=A0A7Y0L0E3_9FIRM|nr:HD domain-containing protein [Sulfobacillus harzensis]
MRGNGQVSIDLPVILAAGIALGPGAGLWIGAIGSLTWRELSGQIRWPSVLFNRAQFGITAWASVEAFRVLGGSSAHLSIARASGPLLVASIVAFVLNLIFVIMPVALREGRPLAEITRVYFKWMLPSFFVMLPIGYLMAAVYRVSGPWPELIFLLPLIGVRAWMVLVKRLRDMYNHTIRVLLVGLDAKDPYTFGHSMRVGQYGAVLARYMKLPEDVVEQIRHAGMLHDIGKMAIPDNVLNKRGRLTIRETYTIQRHPVLGSSMLTQVQIGGCARDWVLHHHERWDGTGYPDGMVGEEIPLETRIVSIVDAYDAMTSDRPYRKAMSHEAAVAEILEESGTQFDPIVVEQFINLCSEVNLAAEEGAGHGWDRTPNIPIEELQAEYERELQEYLSRQHLTE